MQNGLGYAKHYLPNKYDFAKIFLWIDNFRNSSCLSDFNGQNL